MIDLYVVSNILSAAVAVATLDGSGADSAARHERILVVVNNSLAPELALPWHQTAAARALLGRFDRAVYLNELLHPFHPGAWNPRPEDLPILERLARSQWRLGTDEVHLVADSITEMPGSTIADIFHTARVSVVSSGLSAYGPTPGSQPLSVVQRLENHIFLDLLPGVRPLLLAEHGLELKPVPLSAYMSVIAEMTRGVEGILGELVVAHDTPTALVIGQHLSTFELISADDELELHLEMMAAALSRGARRVLFRPHPACPPTLALHMRHYAREGGIELAILPGSLPAEVVAGKVPLECAVSCDSAALIALAEAFGIAPVSVGTELLLQRMAPFQNQHRMAATVVDAITRDDTPYANPIEVQRLIDMVAYCMQPKVLPHFRAEAESLLLQMPYEERRRYVKKRRLSALGLPPGEEPPPPPDPDEIRRRRSPVARATRWLHRSFGGGSTR